LDAKLNRLIAKSDKSGREAKIDYRKRNCDLKSKQVMMQMNSEREMQKGKQSMSACAYITCTIPVVLDLNEGNPTSF